MKNIKLGLMLGSMDIFIGIILLYNILQIIEMIFFL